jgi:hypothetical protein
MEDYLKDTLQKGRQALAEADPDELLKDFLEFEETATGPTVNEMFAALNIPTEEILNVKPLHRR